LTTTPDPGGVPAGLLHDHGERWQIERIVGTDGGPDKWLAIERPQVRPLARFYVASSAVELRDLLDNDHALRRW
jgi:hypothetical protein